MKLNDIDPAFNLMKEFSKITKGTTAHIQKMRQDAIFTNGTVQSKYKTLTALIWSISSRCEPCVKYYADQSQKHGATEEELGEFLAVASTMGGCVGETWALKAYKAFKDSQAGESASNVDHDACCES